MKSKTLFAVLAALLLTSCATSGPGNSGCEWARPIYTDRAGDVLTEDTAGQILEHNRTGAKVCGWKARAA